MKETENFCSFSSLILALHIDGTNHTMHDKINAAAKSDPPKPSWNPMLMASAQTVDEWEEGIPPDPMNCFKSHRFSLYLQF